ncbi:MAG: glycosyltransferase [Candidatus Thorarchaeota archaeon]|jgi:UDP-N-acetylglucosamine transferase subunit ALG13
MIFVTVGTAHYDPLIQKMDELVRDGIINDMVVGQIGRGSFLPENFRYFRFLRSLNSAYEKAEIIVSTGGAGTTMECVTRGLKLVVIENKTLMEGHQAQLIGEMARRGHLIWCKNLAELTKSIDAARSKEFPKFSTDETRIPQMISELLSR